MASYRIEWKYSASKEIRKLSKSAISRVLEAVAALAPNPYPAGCKKLQGSGHTYRIRTGDYRIVYTVFSDALIVEIVRVRHRKDIYRKPV